MSSAKRLVCDVMFLEISLIYITNKMSPNTVPWGTPDKMEVQDEWYPAERLASIGLLESF